MRCQYVSFILVLVVGLTLGGCGGGGGGGTVAPIADLTGSWDITERGTSTCLGEESYSNAYSVSIVQSGNTVTVTAPAGVFSGTVNGDQATWSGNYPEDGGITTINSLLMRIAADGNSMSGTSSWTWSDGSETCSGTGETITAVRISGTAPPPAAPDNLSATAASQSTADLTWRDNADDETGFSIERSTSSSSGFVQIDQVSADVQAYADSGLNAGTTYYYRVLAYNGNGESTYSNVSSATTDLPPAGAPAAPAGLAATAFSSDSIQLDWTDNADNETEYRIERSLNQVTGFSEIAGARPDSTSFTDAVGLAAATTYYYRVCAINAAGASAYSNTASDTTFPLAAAPTAPSGLTATATSASTISLSWADNADDETGFKIERSAAATSGFIQIGATTGNTTSFDDATGLEPAMTYYYRVRATNANGDSAYSNIASDTTFPLATSPAAPGSLAVTAVTTGSVGLSWSDNSDNESGFRIHSAGSVSGPFDVVALSGPDTVTASVNNLLSGSTYYFKVEAFNEAGASVFSNTVNATTTVAATPPASPGSVTILNITESGARLVWSDNATDESGYEVGTCGLPSVSGDLYLCAGTGNFTAVASLPANSTSYTFTGLSPATGYVRFVRAVNAAGASSAPGRSFSTLAAATTVDLTPLYSNVIIKASLDASYENTAYPGSFPQVGCNWTYDWLFESYTQNFVCGQSVFNFDLSSLVGKTILGATLTLKTDLAPLDSSRQYRMSAVATPWEPSTLTWNWTMNNLQYYTASSVSFDPPLYAGQELVFDVTQTVQNWVDLSWGSYGFLLEMPDLLFPYDTRFQVSQFDFPTLRVTYQ